MKYLKIYLLIFSFFLLHIIFNVLNKNYVSETLLFSWLLVLACLVGFIWIIDYVKKSNLRHKFIVYLLSSLGILLSIAQVVSWYILKDFGF